MNLRQSLWGCGCVGDYVAVVAFLIGVLASVGAQPLNNPDSQWPTLLFRLLRLPSVPHDIPGAPHTQRMTERNFLLPNDFERAMVLPERAPSDEELQAMQLPTLFEGDILGIPSNDESVMLQHDAYSDEVFRLPYQSALNLGTYPDKLWPDGRVPYMLEEALDKEQRAAIAQAFDEYRNKTCIRFVPRNDDDYDYLFVKKNKHFGCSSYVGRAGGNQTVSLEISKCFTKGIIAHELMHALGFFHEHSRTDRDAHVNIIEANVKPGMLRNFEKYPHKIIDSLDMPYDYDSVMHYHKLAFSRNGKPTILPKQGEHEIGQRFRLSEIDAKKVNKLYGCAEDANGLTTKKPTDPDESATTTTKPEKECKNLNPHCEMWADIGHCKWSSKYMNHYCRKSCALCSSTPSPAIRPNTRCLDRNLFCGYWARIGECKTESKFMKIFCQRSCGLCREEGITSPDIRKPDGNTDTDKIDEEFRHPT